MTTENQKTDMPDGTAYLWVTDSGFKSWSRDPRKNGESVKYIRADLVPTSCFPLMDLRDDADKGWQPIETAKKNGKSILLKVRDDICAIRDNQGLKRWAGIIFVGRHPGLTDNGFDIGWNMAAPVGHGGFPDEWFEGWMPLPDKPQTGEKS